MVRGTYYVSFCGTGCKYIILSARFERNIRSNGAVDARTQLQDGYECYLAKKMEQIFLMNKIQKKIEVESSKYLKQAATCVTPGIYYKSCTCGAKSNSEFYTGHLRHDYTVKVKKKKLV